MRSTKCSLVANLLLTVTLKGFRKYEVIKLGVLVLFRAARHRRRRSEPDLSRG